MADAASSAASAFDASVRIDENRLDDDHAKELKRLRDAVDYHRMALFSAQEHVGADTGHPADDGPTGVKRKVAKAEADLASAKASEAMVAEALTLAEQDLENAQAELAAYEGILAEQFPAPAEPAPSEGEQA